jgi:hypothetical protein
MPNYDSDDDTDKRGDKFDDEPSQSDAPPPSYQGGPPQRQHKYSTKDMKPENPWKRWCLTILLCLICVAIMIAISILFQKLFNPPEGTQSCFARIDATMAVV